MKMRHIRALLVLLASTAFGLPAYAGPLDWLFGPPLPHDPGGYVHVRVAEIQEANRSRQIMHVKGICDSSCTMKFGARRVCVDPDAVIRFHSAAVFGAPSPEGNRQLMSYYPPRIKAWVRQHRALDTLNFTTMTGREAIALGIPQCRD